jgi:5'-nucleotidase
MRILVTNDDGLNSVGLKILVELALNLGEVICIAPMEEQSGKSHSIVIKKPFKVVQYEDIIEGVKTYGVSSTPADCVRVAQYYLMEDFDVVFSGINNGYNLGEDILYSGTVGAATEAVLCGKKAIAFSTTRNSYENVTDEFAKVFKLIEEKQLLDMHYLWNINVCDSPLGVKFTTQGKTYFDAYYEELGNNDIFSRGAPDLSKEEDVNTDVCAIYNHYISITPLTVDRTAHNILQKINNN